jgi:DNA polymerase I-like protein with 3'-5' exonuclease and polymerase domains
MQQNGMLVDVDAWRSMLDEADAQRLQLETAIFQQWGRFNLKSDAELKAKLAEHGYDVGDVQGA